MSSGCIPQIKVCAIHLSRTLVTALFSDQVWVPPINKRIYLEFSKFARSGICQALGPPSLKTKYKG